MNRYQMSFAASLEHKPTYPERTARKSTPNWDMAFQVWPNRASMARSIRMQERGQEVGQVIWKACVALTPGEGY